MAWISLWFLLFTAPHPDSVSRSLVTVDGARATVELRFQSLSLIEVLPVIDLDGDGLLSVSEVGAGRGAIEAYLLGGYQLRIARAGTGTGTGTGSDLGTTDVLLSGRLEAIEVRAEAELGPLDLQWMRVRLEFEASGPIGAFSIRSRLFHEQNPWHRDIAGVVWNGEEEVRHLFVADADDWEFRPEDERRPGVLVLFLRLGFRHILEGYDHLAFLLVLLVASKRFKSLVGVVTAFTLSHSITLALAALDPGGLLGMIPGRFVELAIALSIAYVACENLLVKEARNPWIEAFGFGLLHGLGFAGFLGDALEGENLVVTALFGFNLGVELGQLAVVLVVCALLWGWKRFFVRADESEEPPSLAPRWFRLATSSVVAVLGFYLFVERAGWLG